MHLDAVGKEVLTQAHIGAMSADRLPNKLGQCLFFHGATVGCRHLWLYALLSRLPLAISAL